MGCETCAEGPADQLARSLTRIAADPGQTQHLHEILGGYCHQSRNLLNGLKMSLYLARRGGPLHGPSVWCELEPRYLEAERFIDRLQQVCRPMPLNAVRLPLDLLIEDRQAAWGEALAARGRRLILEPPRQRAVGAFDPARLGQGFDDLVAWRARDGDPAHDLRLRWSAADGMFHVAWDEPACGNGGPPGAGPKPPAGDALAALTVPLLTRVMTLHAGSLDVTGLVPWRLGLRWPLDLPSP